MKRLNRFAIIVALLGVFTTNTAEAARRSALANNLLITDVKDIFWLPHEVAQYINYVWFDFLTGVAAPVGAPTGAGDPSLGSGGILFGNATTNSFGIGIATHRSDHQGAIRETFGGFGDFFHLNRNAGVEDGETIYAAPFAVDTLQWIDLLVGFQVSREFDLGARLSIGSNVLDQADRDGPNEGIEVGDDATSINVLFSGGYDNPTDTLNLDFALELTFASFGHTELAGDEEIQDDGSTFGFGLAGRGLFELGESIDLGVLAALDIRNKTSELDDSAFERLDNEVSEIGFLLGIGPVYYIGEEAVVSAYATLGVSQRTEDPEGQNNLTDGVAWLLPGIRISAEWWLTDFFAYRAGLSSEYRLVSGEQQSDDPTGGVDTTARSLLFYWSNGIGFSALEGDFNLDAMLNWPIITNGPYFLSGNSNAMFAMVTASYAF